MTATIAFFAFLALIVVAIQRNHARQRYFRQSFDGRFEPGTTAIDRDVERIRHDLLAVDRR